MGQDLEQGAADDLARLRKAVEQEMGQRLLNPKDFVYLSECIAERTHQHIGVNTLKRIWGKLDERVTPRPSTLNLLAQFVGAEGWDDFCRLSGSAASASSAEPLKEENAEQIPPPTENNDTTADTPAARRFRPWVVLLAVLLAMVGIGGVRYYRAKATPATQLEDSLQRVSARRYLLRQGRRFDSHDDYLKLFGLVGVSEYPYFQVHPQHPHLVLWGPEYHNAHWGNDGDAAKMMPTITERWAPRDTLPELVAMRNSELYYNGRRNRDIRLTFMKGLDGDSDFVFLGVYRFSLTQSDTTHIVWERVAEEADLLHLEALEPFRE